MKTILTTLGVSLLVLAGCTGQKQAESNFIQENMIMRWHRRPFRPTLLRNQEKF